MAGETISQPNSISFHRTFFWAASPSWQLFSVWHHWPPCCRLQRSHQGYPVYALSQYSYGTCCVVVLLFTHEKESGNGCTGEPSPPPTASHMWSSRFKIILSFKSTHKNPPKSPVLINSFGIRCQFLFYGMLWRLAKGVSGQQTNRWTKVSTLCSIIRYQYRYMYNMKYVILMIFLSPFKYLRWYFGTVLSILTRIVFNSLYNTIALILIDSWHRFYVSSTGIPVSTRSMLISMLAKQI